MQKKIFFRQEMLKANKWPQSLYQLTIDQPIIHILVLGRPIFFDFANTQLKKCNKKHKFYIEHSYKMNQTSTSEYPL